MWKVPTFMNPSETNSIELVLVDEKGGKIHATIKKQLLYMFQSKIEEGEKYAEVHTSFVRRNVGRLDGFWSIEKTDTDYHKLRFNDNYGNPLNAAIYCDLAAFIDTWSFKYLVLCGENGKRCRIQVLNAPDIHRMKLAYNWKDFCASQDFKVGDKIRFKFDKNVVDTDSSNPCHVFKLGF
ncbi:replication protein A 70 kDa DNA-binding subunit [Trifolium repens]|nr:replication protein A 70 kDa DNA-binding subunit [Trifolium repens]